MWFPSKDDIRRSTGRRLLLTVCLASASHAASAQVPAATAPTPDKAKLDALIQELQGYIPNRGTLALGHGDTILYSAVLTGTRRIPLADVEVAILPDSFRAGFRCTGVQPCIVYDPGPTAKPRIVQMVDEVTWAIGSVRRNADRVMVFQGDPVPFKRVTDALNSLVGERARVRTTEAGTVPASSAAERAARQVALGLMNLPESRWTTIVADTARAVAVDLQSVQTENGFRLAWVRARFTPAIDSPEGWVRTVFTEQRFDCLGKRTQATRTVLVLSSSVVAHSLNNKWTSVAADPTVRGILDRVCATPN